MQFSLLTRRYFIKRPAQGQYHEEGFAKRKDEDVVDFLLVFVEERVKAGDVINCAALAVDFLSVLLSFFRKQCFKCGKSQNLGIPEG